MIIFELNKEDSEYAERISQLSEMSIVVEDPKSFCSDLNTVIQIGVSLAPYAISAVTLIIIELIKNKKKIKIKVSNEGFEIEGDEEKVIEIAQKLINEKQEEKAQEVLQKLLEGNLSKS